MKTLRCGAAEKIVTPALGLNIPCCMAPHYSTGIKDDLYTHALAVECDGKTVILISIDTSGLGSKFSKKLRAAITAEIGVPAEAIMVCATHIHTGGPQLLDIFWGQGEDEEVNELFHRQSLAAAVEAYNKMVEVNVRFGECEEHRIAFCRNYHMKDGTILMNPGRTRAANIVKPTTAIDPTVGAIRFDDLSGKTVAEIVNFACHPDTVGGYEYSADYPGAMRQELKKAYGDHTVVFINGCSGNINHVDYPRYVSEPEFKYPKDHYKYMGGILAEDVLGIHEKNETVAPTPVVDYAVRRFRAKRRQPTEADMAWADEKLALVDGSKVDKRLAEELYRLKKHPKKTEIVEMQVLRIGDLYVVGFPGEPFSDIATRLREKTAGKDLMISEIANNVMGYFATEPAFSGNVYEARLPSDPFETDVLDKMIDVAAELVEKLAKQ